MKKLLLVITLMASGYLQAKQTITMGVVVFPPLTVIDENSGKCVGRVIDVTRKIFEAYQYDVDAFCIGAARIFKMVESGEVDLTLNIKSTSALAKNALFIEPKYTDLQLNFYQNSDLSTDYPVAAIRSYDYNGFRQKFVQKGMQIVDLTGSLDTLQLFASGRAYGVLSYAGPYNYYINQIPHNKVKNILIENLAEIPSHYAVSRKSKHLNAIISILRDYAIRNGLVEFEQDVSVIENKK